MMSQQPKSASRNIYLDTQAAEQNMQKLVDKSKALKQSIDSGELSGKALVRAIKNLDTVNADIKKVQDQLDKGLKPTLQQQTNLVRNLRNELARMSESDAGFKEKLENYRKQNAELSNMSSRLRTVEQSGDKTEGAIGGIVKAAAGLFVFDKVKGMLTDLFTGATDEADEAAEAVDGLRVSLLNAGRIDVFERLLGQADEFAAKYRALDNDDVTKVFTKLVDYGKLTESQITETTDVVINFARRQKISLEEAADVITKGFEGSGKALKTFGINLKDANDFTSRYNLVVQGLGEKVKGVEAAFEQTNQGIKKGFQQRLRDVKEEIGKFLYSLLGIEQQQFQNAVAAKKDADQASVLVARYEQLSKQTKLTTADKKELKDITTTLAGKFGDSVIEVDKETGALKLNVQATKDLITQKLLLANSKAVEIAAKLNKAQNDELENTRQLQVNTELYNEALKKVGKTQKEVNKEVQYYATGGGLMGGGTGTTDTRTQAEKQLDTFIGAMYTSGNAAKQARTDIEKYTKQLSELGFTAADVNKLLNPKGPDAVVGKGRSSSDDDQDAIKKIAELRKQYEELMRQVRISTAQASGTLEGAFTKILEEIGKQIALVDEAYKKGAINQQEYIKATSAIRFAADKESDVAFAASEKERQARRRQDLDTMREILELMKQAAKERDQLRFVRPQSEMTNGMNKAYDYYSRDRKAGAELAVIKATAAQNNEARLKAQLELLDIEVQNELSATELTENQKEIIRAKYEERRKELTQKVAEDNLNELFSVFKQSADFLTSMSNVAMTNENRNLQLQLRNNDIAKQGTQRLMQAKVITAQEAAQRISQIDADADKRKRALEMRQFERNKRIQEAQAMINGAMGVTAALAAMPGAADIISLGAFRALQIAFTVSETFAQLSVINAQKPSFGSGGYLTGPSHSGGGMPVLNPVTGQKEAEVEGGEVILSKETVRNNGNIVGALLHSSMYRNGMNIEPFYQTRPLQSMNYPAITGVFRKYANGGVFDGSAGGMTTQANSDNLAVMMELTTTVQNLQKRLEVPFTGYITQRQMDDSNTRKAQIMSEARIL